MNYQKIYDNIINNAKSVNRIKGEGIYYEEHHIIPVCLEGSDNEDNKVLLTAKEHFVCHKLLTKIYPKHKGIRWAYISMCQWHSSKQQRHYKISARDYQYAREIVPEPWNKGTKGLYTYSEDTKNKMRGKGNGRYKAGLYINYGTEEYKEKWRFINQVNKIIHPKVKLPKKEVMSKEELRYFMSKRQKGRVKSPEEIQKQVETKKLKNKRN